MTTNGSSEDIGIGLRQSVGDHPAPGRPEAKPAGGFAFAADNGEQTRDWSAALDLVREASAAIRIRDERATETDIEHRLDVERANEDIRTLQEQLDEAEVRLAETEARVRAAEARALEAEGWLAKMHDAIVASFGRDASDDDTAEAELRAALAEGGLGGPP